MGVNQLQRTIVEFIFEDKNAYLLADIVDYIQARQAEELNDEENLTKEQVTSLRKATNDFHEGEDDNAKPWEEIKVKYEKWL